MFLLGTLAPIVFSSFFLSTVMIPIEIQSSKDFRESNELVENLKQYKNIFADTRSLDMNAPFSIYMMAVLSFVGWFLFVCFVGIGMVALPIDLINTYRDRPRSMRSDEVERRKFQLLKYILKLRQLGKSLEDMKPKAEQA